MLCCCFNILLLLKKNPVVCFSVLLTLYSAWCNHQITAEQKSVTEDMLDNSWCPSTINGMKTGSQQGL